MECRDLTQLRQEATRLFREFKVRRQRAREYAAQSSGQRFPAAFMRPSDYESYLQRRVFKTAALIESHIVVHRCQE